MADLPPWEFAWTSDFEPFGIPLYSYYRYLRANWGPKGRVVTLRLPGSGPQGCTPKRIPLHSLKMEVSQNGGGGGVPFWGSA